MAGKDELLRRFKHFICNFLFFTWDIYISTPATFNVFFPQPCRLDGVPERGGGGAGRGGGPGAGGIVRGLQAGPVGLRTQPVPALRPTSGIQTTI